MYMSQAGSNIPYLTELTYSYLPTYLRKHLNNNPK